jgi:hypothetical protein
MRKKTMKEQSPRLVPRERCYAVDLFVHFHNARQIRKRNHPRYPAPLATMI